MFPQVFVVLAVLAGQLAGQAPQPLPLAPGVRYNPAIPTLQQVVGHDVGEKMSSPEEIHAYLKALAAAAPDRVRIVEYARSWEGRPLHLLVIGAPERIARLDQVKGDLRRLADPRSLTPADAERLINELPVVTWLIHSVHGNEVTSSDAALAEAYHILAADGDAGVDLIRRHSIVLIDPLQNPDGRARFLSVSEQARAAEPDAHPAAAERDEPWPGGRSNHYLFDMNRDYLGLSQPETRGRVKIGLEFYPHVVADLHEMDGDSTYYFAPPAEPANPYITPKQFEWLTKMGRENARRFDERGFEYFVREVFDSYYPGYGESWPIFQGAIGMTFEQASPRGLRVRREDKTILTYREGVVHHFTAAITTAETAARNREALLRDFFAYRRSAVQDGEKGAIREYLIPPGNDPARVDRLAELLALHGVEVRRALEPIKTAARTLAAGTLIVPLAQPASRLARNLIDPAIQMDEAFIKEQERRKKKRLGDQIYDVTAWSLPLLFDLEIVPGAVPVSVRTERAVPAAVAGTPLPAARIGYLMPWGTAAAEVSVEALKAGVRIHTADEPFTHGGRKYPIGTAIVRVSDNGPTLAATLGPIVRRHRAEVVPIDESWTDAGISLGSSQVVTLKVPRVAMAWDVPAQSGSAGWTRFVLERRFGQAVTVFRTETLRFVDLRDFDVVVLAAGNYSDALGEDGIRRLKDWARAGGTIITLGEASRWATRDKVGLLGTRTELRGGKPDIEPSADEKKPSEEPKKPFDLEQAIQPDREPPDSTPGAIVRVVLDMEHWLSAGFDGEIQAIVEGQRIFTPIKLDKGRNVGVYAAKDRLIAAGFTWDNPKDQLPQKAFLLHQPIGQGHIIAFAEDPNYRAIPEATQLLFINAVLLGPAH